MKILHDADRGRFFAVLEHGEAELTYEWVDDSTVAFTHTYVPRQDRQHGEGARIVLHALDWAREHGLSVIPSCPFVPRVLAEHPEYQDLEVGAG